MKLIEDGKPCGHNGCLSNLLHPCDLCGRIAGRGDAMVPNSTERTYNILISKKQMLKAIEHYMENVLYVSVDPYFINSYKLVGDSIYNMSLHIRVCDITRNIFDANSEHYEYELHWEDIKACIYNYFLMVVGLVMHVHICNVRMLENGDIEVDTYEVSFEDWTELTDEEIIHK